MVFGGEECDVLAVPTPSPPTPKFKMHVPDIDTEKCLSFLSKLVQIKSYSETDGEFEITSFIAERMKQIGLEADVVPFAEGKRQNAIGRNIGKRKIASLQWALRHESRVRGMDY